MTEEKETVTTEEAETKKTDNKSPSEGKTEKDKTSKLKAENKDLSAQVEKLKAELAESGDKYMRMLAEYENFRKRSQKEKEGIYSDAYGDALKEILPIEDNLERAVQYSDSANLADGVRMILKQFEDVLKKLGIESYGARGDAFDPVIHDAVMQTEDSELGENTVAEVLQKGYRKGDKIIRHAVVKVANV